MHKRQRRAKQLARNLLKEQGTTSAERQQKQQEALTLASLVLALDGAPENERLGRQLADAIIKAGGLAFIRDNYPAIESLSDGEKKKLHKAATEMARDKWQDPGTINTVSSVVLSVSQLLACAGSVYDHARRRGRSEATSGFFGASNGFANFYFALDSLSYIIDGIGIYLKELTIDKDPEVRKKALKSLPKEIFALACGAAAASIDQSFVVDSKKAFEDEAGKFAYGAILGLSSLVMSLIYYDSAKKLLDIIPTSDKERKELQKDIYDLCLGLEQATEQNSISKQIVKAICKNTIPTGVTLAISLSKAGIFIGSTYENYKPDLGSAGSFFLTALAALPSTCLAVSSALGSQKFLRKKIGDYFCAPDYVEQVDDAEAPAQIIEGAAAHRQDNPCLKLATNILQYVVIPAGFICSASGNASLANTHNLWLLACCTYISLVTTARGYLAGMKSKAEIRETEEFIRALEQGFSDSGRIEGKITDLLRKYPPIENGKPGNSVTNGHAARNGVSHKGCLPCC